MKKILIFLSVIVFWGCENSKYDDSLSYQVMNTIIDYHESIKFKYADVFPNNNDTIYFGDFIILPESKDLINIVRKDSNLFFAINGWSSEATLFNNYFALSDSIIISSQIKDYTTQLFDSARINHQVIANDNNIEYLYQIDSLISIYKKDIIVFGKPLFNKEKNQSVISYGYAKKDYNISNIVLLKKDTETSDWQIGNSLGIVLKYVPSNDSDTCTSIATIFVGAIKRKTSP